MATKSDLVGLLANLTELQQEALREAGVNLEYIVRNFDRNKIARQATELEMQQWELINKGIELQKILDSVELIDKKVGIVKSSKIDTLVEDTCGELYENKRLLKNLRKRINRLWAKHDALFAAVVFDEGEEPEFDIDP